MHFTREQTGIIHAKGNIKINAVAGSGKTTTLVEYAKARPASSKILYLAFNKSVKLEAIKKFSEQGAHNVKVETAHSLAYKHIVLPNNYTVRANGYKTRETANLLGLKGTGERHTEYVIANHISRFIAYFCNSNKAQVSDLNYLDVVSGAEARTFVKTFYSYIQSKARLFLSKMNEGHIAITHDFYLKKLQLASPELPYDYILFDEGQDASPAMLDIFLKQNATKVIVGDTHQQIYSWRYAVNSLEKTDFTNYHLSKSFRFGNDIAGLAKEILKWKKSLGTYSYVPIEGKGENKQKAIKAVLARSNLGLLLKAIEYVTEKQKVNNIYFEGNIHSYTYADDGTSLYDVLNLYNGKRYLIKDELIREMKDMADLEAYIDKTEDAQMGMMVEIVKAYGDAIPEKIKTIKSKHVDNDDKAKAEIIFSTVHRCKGMEYDAIHIVNDFITEDKLEKRKEEVDINKLNEEINLLYVAITRARNTIHIPESLLPDGFPSSEHINVMPEKKAEAEPGLQTTGIQEEPDFLPSLTKHKNSEQVKTKNTGCHSNTKARQPWTPELDEELTNMFCKNASLKEMALHFGRTKGGIMSRIKKLGLRELYSQ